MQAPSGPARRAGEILVVLVGLYLPSAVAAQQVADSSGASPFAIASAGLASRKGSGGGLLAGIAAGTGAGRNLEAVLRAAVMAEIGVATEHGGGIHSYLWFLDVGADYTLFVARGQRSRVFASLGAGGMLKRSASGHGHPEFSRPAWAVGAGLEVPPRGWLGMQFEGRLIRSFDGAEQYLLLTAGVRLSRR